jgi:predicted nucleic acid-binding protein
VKIVLDTSPLINAIRSGRGASAEIIRLTALGKLTVLLDFKLVCEYRDVALRSEHIEASGKTPEDAEAVISMLEAIAVPVLIVVKHRPLCPDVNDNMVMDVAINDYADAIVTNNVRDFAPAAKRFGIPVLLPGDFLDVLRKGDRK